MYEFKVENKNIVITDPCYLDNVMNKKDETEKLKNYWHKFLGGNFCDSVDDCSDRLKKFKFTENICCSTLYGDWSCTTYNVKRDPREINTIEDLEQFEKIEDWREKYSIGKFCADAGMVCVVDSDELKEFNPHFFEWACFHQHCVTFIHEFTGTIGVTDIDPHEKDYPNYRIRLIYGIADKEKNKYVNNFLAYQTGL